jgi:hypothetical protein
MTTATKEKKVEAPAVAEDPVRALWKEESRMVKGIFRCHEPRGGCVTFSFKKFKWDPVKSYTMYDGMEYEIPLSVARHLNNNCNRFIHTRILDAQGNPLVDKAGQKESRMNFESLDFF